MRIINQTTWRTDHLRALIKRVAQDELSAHQRKILRVTVQYRKANGRRTGYAHIGTPYHQVLTMRLLVPRPPLAFDKPSYALTIAHEMAHCRGLRHSEMRSSRYHWVEGWQARYAYANDYPMETQAKASVEKPDDTAKHQHALAMMAAWRTKAKAATTRLKKWSAKARYYERKMAAAVRP